MANQANHAPQVILFYSIRQKYGEFSNFFKSPIFIDGRWYPTVEHWFQCMKTLDEKRREQIRTATSAGKAARLGRAKRRTILRNDWESTKDDFMYRGCMAKFSQHERLWGILDGTGDAVLVEHTDNDSYWGDGGDGSGRNQLGKTLMRVREELRAAYALMMM